MKYLKIQNNGELDIRLVALMGGTTKQNDKFKIGKFGTGLKYTLAYLYRNNIDFKCFSGATEVKIHTESELIGEQTFDIICINHQRTSITTGMGHDWSGWMIIRELWCNALDEGGSLKDVVNETQITGEEGKTSFYVQLTPDMTEVLNNWDTYFRHNETPMFEDENYAIYKGTGPLKLYKQGVLIYQSVNHKSLFDYDIKGASINELREFKGILSMEILGALSKPSKEVVNYFFTHIKEDHYEACDMDYDWYHTFGSVWKEALNSKKIVSYDTIRDYNERGIDPDQIKHAIALPKKVYKALTKAFEGVGALRMADRNTEFYEVSDDRILERTEEVIALLKSCNYEINPKLKIVYGIFADKNKRISVNRKTDELLVSSACYPLEISMFAGLVIEYNELYNTGYMSYSNDMQNHLVKVITKLIMKDAPVEVIPET